MICPKCRSQMFVADEAVNPRSHVTFYRCSLCVSEHVSSGPAQEPEEEQNSEYFASSSMQRTPPLML